MKKQKAKSKKQKLQLKGQATLVAVTFLLLIFLAFIFGFSYIAIPESGIAKVNLDAKQSYFLTEAGVEDVVYRIINGMNYSPTELITLNGSSATITTTAIGGSQQQVTSQGDVSTAIRKIQAVVQLNDVGISFNYGAHIDAGGLDMSSNSVVNGNVYSNGNITGSSNSQINGDAWAVGTISSPKPDVSGTKTEGASVVPLPPIDLDYWRVEANINNDPISGNYTLSSGADSFGPKKVDGNFTLDGNSQFTVTGPLHITGNFEMNSNTDLFLDSSFGSNGTVIVVDGTIRFDSNAQVHATGAAPNGYILFVTPSPSGSAIEVNSNAVMETALYATTGTTAFHSNGDVVSVTTYRLELDSNAVINYDIGLANATFTTGPSGGFTISSWKEIE